MHRRSKEKREKSKERQPEGTSLLQEDIIFKGAQGSQLDKHTKTDGGFNGCREAAGPTASAVGRGEKGAKRECKTLFWIQKMRRMLGSSQHGRATMQPSAPQTTVWCAPGFGTRTAASVLAKCDCYLKGKWEN